MTARDVVALLPGSNATEVLTVQPSYRCQLRKGPLLLFGENWGVVAQRLRRRQNAQPEDAPRRRDDFPPADPAGDAREDPVLPGIVRGTA